MILTRIKRGAARTQFLAKNNSVKLTAFRPIFTWQTAEKVVLMALTVRTAVLPTPAFAANAQQVDDTEPPSLLRISASAVNALTFNENGATISVTLPSLSGIQVGTSVDDAQHQEEAQQAAQAAADAEAAKQAEEAAQAAADAAEAAAQASTITVESVPVATYDQQAVIQMIRDAAGRYGLSEAATRVTLSIAQCESGNNPNARNPNSTASGTFQMLTSTFKSNAYPGQQIFNAYDNIDVAVRKISTDGFSAWNASRSCWGNQYVPSI